MKEYKFRAECLTDFMNLLIRFDYKNHKVPCEYVIRSIESFPDIEVELRVDLEKVKLMSIMDEVEDGHVMWRTVDDKVGYTGDVLRYELKN